MSPSKDLITAASQGDTSLAEPENESKSQMGVAFISLGDHRIRYEETLRWVSDMTPEAARASIEVARLQYAVPAEEKTKQAAEETKRAAEETKRASEETKRAAEETKRAAEETLRAIEETKQTQEETKRSSHVTHRRMLTVGGVVACLITLAFVEKEKAPWIDAIAGALAVVEVVASRKKQEKPVLPGHRLPPKKE